ncbi:MAG: DUF4124 domain-containing protein [Azonexus sp.]|nr:DUF4124 domain-containing protein [Azonexus sp.]
MHRIILPLLAGLLLTQPAGAEIYKCRLPGGKVEISNSPCPGGSGTVAVRPEETVSEANRQQAERDVERMRNFVDRRESAQRAEAAAERQAQSQRQAAGSPPPLRYGDPDACLRDLAQQALEATQRAQLEAECRSLVRPPAPQQPVYVVPGYGIPQHHYPPPRPHPRPPPPPPGNAAPSGPSMVICAPGKPCSR